MNYVRVRTTDLAVIVRSVVTFYTEASGCVLSRGEGCFREARIEAGFV